VAVTFQTKEETRQLIRVLKANNESRCQTLRLLFYGYFHLNMASKNLEHRSEKFDQRLLHSSQFKRAVAPTSN